LVFRISVLEMAIKIYISGNSGNKEVGLVKIILKGR
jgi:hypothetical protein